VRKKGGDGESVGSESLSITFRYINLTGLSIGLVELCGPIHLCLCERRGWERGGSGLGNTVDVVNCESRKREVKIKTYF
jgi:hypothetical protein